MPAISTYNAGMKTMQYTIRQVPEQVDRLVRLQAKKERKSLNAVLLEIIKRGIGLKDGPMEYHDLDELAGSWVFDPEFDAAMKTFASIDEELWK